MREPAMSKTALSIPSGSGRYVIQVLAADVVGRNNSLLCRVSLKVELVFLGHSSLGKEVQQTCEDRFRER